MTEEYETGICSANWWNSARNVSTPCSTTLTDIGSFEWPNDIEMKGRTSCDDSVSVSCNSMVYQGTQRPHESDSIGGENGCLVESLHMMGYNLSSPTPDWNQALLSPNRNRGRTSQQLDLSSMVQEELCSRPTFQPESGDEKDWSPKNYSDGSEDNTSINQVFTLEQHGGLTSSKNPGDCKEYSQGLPMSYPTVSATILPAGLFEPDQSQQPSYCMMNYPSPTSYNMDLNEMSPSLQPFVKSSSPKCNYDANQLHFSNNTRFWNASSDVRSSLSDSLQTQYLASAFKDDSNCRNLATRKLNDDEVGGSSSVNKRSNEMTFKRPRIETPSPLPTFKVRKEKLGDRVTALQQLVSPFGKTDTASVLFEAIEYIKFLHEQVGVLSTPYMKNGAHAQYQQEQNPDKSKDTKVLKKDLTSRGLCLVPISSTFPVTNETTAEFWTPTFGGSYR